MAERNQFTIERVQAELADITANPPPNCLVEPVGDNLFEWKATLKGPEGTPYQGGVFSLSVLFPTDYPFSAPKINFITKIYHCNVDEEGKICLDFLQLYWSPVLSVSKILLSICSLLHNPNPDDALVPQIAQLLIKDKKDHDEKAKLWTQLYAFNK